MNKFRKMMHQKYKKTKKSSIAVYYILRILVILCAVSETINGNYWNTFLCVVTLFLFTIPTLIKVKFKIDIPSALEGTIYFFIFATQILGEINNFYGIIPHWDTILHTLSGFICAGVGFSLVDLLNSNSNKIKLSPIYVAIVAFCFSMTVGVLWEFAEYGADQLVGYDAQRDTIITSVYSKKLNSDNEIKPIILKNIVSTDIKMADGQTYTIDDGYLDIGINDTMKDLIVNFIGAIAFSILGYIYVKNRDKKSFASKFVPTKL